jgi:hypothetical protein
MEGLTLNENKLERERERERERESTLGKSKLARFRVKFSDALGA